MQFLVHGCHHQHSCDQGLPVGDNEVVLSLALLLRCMQLWPGVRQKEKHKNIRSALYFCHQNKSDIVWCTLVPGNSWKASKCAHGNRRSTEKCNEKALDLNYLWEQILTLCNTRESSSKIPKAAALLETSARSSLLWFPTSWLCRNDFRYLHFPGSQSLRVLPLIQVTKSMGPQNCGRFDYCQSLEVGVWVCEG